MRIDMINLYITTKKKVDGVLKGVEGRRIRNKSRYKEEVKKKGR